MAPRNNVTITFYDDQLKDSNGNTENISGTVTINYKTGDYTLKYNVGGFEATETSSNNEGLNTGGVAFKNGMYSINTGNLNISYSKRVPTSATFTFNDAVGTPDYYTGTGAVTSATCFTTGTLIRTERGDVAVEALAVGDRVVTASGEARPIRWIGHRTIDCRRHPHPQAVMPVHITAHAFGESRPSRHLVVSPGHSICVEAFGETLMPASSLVNGSSIRQIEVERVTYWHVELDSHDILLAENLPAESYLEMGNRGFFVENGSVALDAAPDVPVPTHADFCRPFHESGPLVEAVQARLRERAETLGIAADLAPRRRAA